MYRPRNPRASPLFQLFETNYETVKAVWEERFERQYGFWQGRWDRAVAAYLDCGLFESGFAIVRCPVCKAQYHVAFSCRCRGLCPSCKPAPTGALAKEGAKHAAIFSELLQHQILVDMPHAQWVFSIPKMLRPYFSLPARAFRRPRNARLRDRPRDDGCRHRGARRPARNGRRHLDVWVLIKMESAPIPYVDPHKAELVFRHKLLRLLRDRDLISEERINLLLSWRHSGFSVHNHTTVYPGDTEGLHRLACSSGDLLDRDRAATVRCPTRTFWSAFPSRRDYPRAR